MPIPNRRFIIHSINKYVEEEKKKAESQRGIQDASKQTNPKILPPEFVKSSKKPTYSTKTKKSK